MNGARISANGGASSRNTAIRSRIASGRCAIRYARSFQVATSAVRASSRANQPRSCDTRYGDGSVTPSSRPHSQRSKRAIQRQKPIISTSGSPSVRIATPSPTESPVKITVE